MVLGSRLYSLGRLESSCSGLGSRRDWDGRLAKYGLPGDEAFHEHVLVRASEVAETGMGDWRKYLSVDVIRQFLKFRFSVIGRVIKIHIIDGIGEAF